MSDDGAARRSYRGFFAGSVAGSASETIYEVALPLLVITYLGSNSLGIGAVLAAEQAAWLIFGLVIGAWVDRLNTKRLLVTTALARAGLIAMIPLLALFNALTFLTVLVIAGLLGISSVFATTAQRTAMPRLVERDTLLAANSHLSTATTGVSLVGQLGAGAAARWLGAPLALGLDALLALVSAVSYSRVSVSLEPAQPRHSTLVASIGEGLRTTFRSTSMRTLLVASTISNFVVAFQYTLLFEFIIAELQHTPVAVGVVLAVTTTGSLVGAALNTRVSAALGSARAWLLALAVVPLAAALLPLAPPGLGIILLATGAFLQSVALSTVNINAYTARQLLTPTDQLGRVSATFMFVSWGLMPVGLLLGGLAGTALGTRAALTIAALAFLLPLLSAVFSPLRRRAAFEG